MNLYEMFDTKKEPTLIRAMRDFLPIAVKHLGLDHIPKIKLEKNIKGTHVPTFGRFVNDAREISVVVSNRHPVDILRTLAHEMVHYKQELLNQLDQDSWHTGSPDEDEANAEGGVIMRLFNQAHPEYLSLNPVVTEIADYERDMQSDPSDPISFPKGTTLVNVSDVYDWYKLGMAIPALDQADPRVFNKGVPHTVFAFGSEEEEHKMIPLLKRLGFSLHDIDNPADYEKAIRASDVVEHLEQYVAEKWSAKYKRSIDCSNPKGFSQRAHCQGRKKSNEDTCKTHRSPSGRKTNMCPDDDDYAINYGKDALKENFMRNATLVAALASMLAASPAVAEPTAAQQAIGIARTINRMKGYGPEAAQAEAYQELRNLIRAIGGQGDNHSKIYPLVKDMIRTPGELPTDVEQLPPLTNEPTNENFADGKKPGRKGLAKRSGVDCKKSVTALRKIAKNSSGERQRMAHWCANMKAGKRA